MIRLFGFSRNDPRLAGGEEVLVAAENLKQVTTPRALTTREEEASKVKVVYGVHALEASLAGRTVQSVREALAQPLNISPHAVALVNGQEVESGRVLSPGEVLEFVRYAGEKGGELDETTVALARSCSAVARPPSPPPSVVLQTTFRISGGRMMQGCPLPGLR